jgi:gallate decarboxylase subunit D
MSQNDPVGPLRQLRESFGVDRHRVEALAVVCGGDLVVALQGGAHQHIGATAMAVPRPGSGDASSPASSASVLCVVGHKEDDLARSVALHLSGALECTVTVVAGLHVDNATDADVHILVENCNRIIERLIARLRPPSGQRDPA